MCFLKVGNRAQSSMFPIKTLPLARNSRIEDNPGSTAQCSVLGYWTGRLEDFYSGHAPDLPAPLPCLEVNTPSVLSGKFTPQLRASFRRQLCCATSKNSRYSCVARLTDDENPSRINDADFPDSTLDV